MTSPWLSGKRQILLIGAAIVALLATVAVLLVVLRSNDPGKVGDDVDTPVVGTVNASGLDLSHPGGAVLRIPAGALPDGTRVSLARSRPASLSQLGGLQPDGLAWSVEADTEPVRPIELTMPYDPAKLLAGARPLVVTFDELAGVWLPVETVADPASSRLTAVLPNFSLKTWIGDRIADLAGPASWFEYQTWKLLGNRAAKPDCSANPKPDWVQDVITVEDDNAQLFACVGADGDGFALQAVNNRGYPVVLELDKPFTSARPTLLDSGLGGLLASLFAATGHRSVLLLPTGAAEVSYDPVDSANGHLQGHVRRNSTALLMYLAVELAREAGLDVPLGGTTKLGLWTLECFGRMFSAAGQVVTLDVVSAGNQMISCLTESLTHEVRQWGFDPEDNFGQRLWSKDADKLPSGARNAVKALRVVRALSIAKWTQTAADLFIIDNTAEADLVDVGVRWSNAPSWGPGKAGATYLYQLPSIASAVGSNTGRHVYGELGADSYPQSTGVWVGCDGRPATLIYRLDGDYRRLHATVGLAPHTPTGVAATISLIGDGVTLATLDVSRERIAPLDLDLTGVRELIVAAERTAGTCRASATPYGVLGDAYLVPEAETATLTALPEDFVGTWRGDMIQPGSSRSPYSMEVVFHAGDVGTKIADVRYPDLRCGGHFTLIRASSHAVMVQETITSGTGCVIRGFLEVRPTPDSGLYFAYREHDDLAKPPLAWATLARS